MTFPLSLSSNSFTQHQSRSSTQITKAKPYELPRLAIGASNNSNGTFNNNSNSQSRPTFLTHILNPCSPPSSPQPKPTALPWILNPRNEPAAPTPASPLPLPPMNEHFPSVLAHVDFHSVPEDALPSIRAVFPASFTSLPPSPRPRALDDTAPTAPPTFSASSSTSTNPAPRAHTDADKPSASAFPFQFTFPPPLHRPPTLYGSFCDSHPAYALVRQCCELAAHACRDQIEQQPARCTDAAHTCTPSTRRPLPHASLWVSVPSAATYAPPSPIRCRWR
ncbi:hypothetical protein C8F04DRAFT_158270 [Mycena alexandri]|uniref:Uncharacterized protein n=1 Tax=Mycena alexandri TaxID=1745969 RepID=A0AAD6X726_9AGAR|nr:hypothetical protein C8F04DRAFT_158270 [Mycena alexandri]